MERCFFFSHWNCLFIFVVVAMEITTFKEVKGWFKLHQLMAAPQKKPGTSLFLVIIRQLFRPNTFQSLPCFISPPCEERSQRCDVWVEFCAPLRKKPGCPPQIRATECIKQLCLCGKETSSISVCHTTMCDASRLSVYDTCPFIFLCVSKRNMTMLWKATLQVSSCLNCRTWGCPISAFLLLFC